MAFSNFAFPSDRNMGWPVDTGQVIAFLRDPGEWAGNRYTQLIPIKDGQDDEGSGQMRYSYYVLGRDSAIRVPVGTGGNNGVSNFAWPDGASRKGGGKDEMTPFRMQTGYATRYNKTAWIPNGVKGQPKWDILATEQKRIASVMMTLRMWDLWSNYLGVAANWALGNGEVNSASAASLSQTGTGNWAIASDQPDNPHYNLIQQTILQAMLRIKLQTNSMVKFSDMVLVISVLDAPMIALAPEIRRIYATTRAEKLANLDEGGNGMWGLPPTICGIPFIVEDGAIVTDKMQDSTVAPYGPIEATAFAGRRFIAPSGTAYLLSRPGSLEGAPGSPSYSTVQMYHAGGLMQQEAFPDNEDRTTRLQCSECRSWQMPAAMTGFQITGIV